MKRLTLRTRARMAAAGTVTAAAALVALALPGSAAQAATSVGQATVELSSHSARATGVTYIVSFVATSGLAPGDTVTLTGPSGTTFPASGNNWGLYDDTASNQAGGLNFTSSGGTVTGTVGSITVSPGDEVTIIALGAGNTSATGSHDLTVSTSTDTTPVEVPFTIDTEASRAVTGVTVQVSSAAVSATGVTYTVGFTTTDELWNSESTLKLVAPSGTKFPASTTQYAAYFVNDDGGPSNSCGPSPVTVSTSGNAVTLGCGGAGTAPIPAGNRVTVSITGVKNASSAGTKTLSVTTSSDPGTATGSYRLTSQAGATSVGAPMLTRTSSAAGAKDTTWTAGFTATQGWYDSPITLTAPAGAAFPGSTSDYTISDDATGLKYTIAALIGTPSHTVTMEMAAGFANGEFLASPIDAGDHLTLTITDVTNPTGSGPVSLSAGADPVAVSIPLSGSASTPGLTLTSDSAGASAVEYVAGFTATATKTVTTVNLTFPAGTKFQTSTAPCDVVRDDTTAQESSCLSATVSGDKATLTTPSGFGQFTVSAGDYVTVEAFGVTNTSSTGTQTLGLATTDAPGVALPGFTLSPPAPVTTPVALLDSYAAGATGASYIVSFIASQGLNTGGYSNLAPSSVTITVPGAKFPTAITSACDLFFDASNGQQSTCSNNAPVGSGGDTITLNDLAARVAPGDQVTVFIYGGQNPPASGGTQLAVSTSGSNGPASPPDIDFTAATKVTDPALWLSSAAAGATGVTYTVGFTAGNGLSGGNSTVGWSTVTISAPAGTVFPGNGCTGVTVRDNPYWDVACWSTTGGGTSTLTISTPAVQPKDHVTVTIAGVTNAAAGSKTLHVSTSSDTTLAAVTYHLT